MRCARIIWLLVVAAAFASGCKSRSDLVEAELRLKDRQLREMRESLDSSTGLNEAYEATLRHDRPCSQIGTAYPGVRTLQIGRGSGGIDEDRMPGDEGVLVVVVPMDADGSAVKVSGNVRITAVQITPEGLKLPLSTWEVSAGYLQRHWKSGLLSTGYYVSLPWQVVPQFEKLRMIAQFTTIDGAPFEAERDLTIHLPGEHCREHFVPPTQSPAILPSPTPTSEPIAPPTPAPQSGSGLPPPVPASYTGPSLSWKPKIPATLQRPTPK